MGTHPKPVGAADALSTLLREGTSHNHREAERRPFMRVFFKGELPREAYVGWISRQWHVYAALESALQSAADDAVIGGIVPAELHRRERLEQDLAFLAGSDWNPDDHLSPATKTYVDRIEWAAAEFAPGVIAHAWLRYLGNVGGQQVLKRLVNSSIGTDGRDGPDDPRGIAFTDYSALGEVGPFFRGFHGRMDAMPLDDAQKQRVVQEGDLGFRLNMQLTDELAEDFRIEAPEGDPDQEYEALTRDA